MNAFGFDQHSFDYITREYTNFMQSSTKVWMGAWQTYWQAWNDFFVSPEQLWRRNLNYFQEATKPPRPIWHTPHTEVELPERIAPLIKLLDFSHPSTDQTAVVPTLVLPPQAGHHSCIADYNDEQSQVKTLLADGLNSIYCLEWLSATAATRNASIEEYVETVRWSVAKIGGKANLVGDCQGGWLATIYAALYPETVNTLVIAGAPIDFQAGEGAIKQSVNFIARNYPDNGMAFYRALVDMGNGNLDGRFLLNGFNVMRPDQMPERYLQLYREMDDPKAVRRYRDMADWYDYTQDVSGKFYLWLVENLFRDNKLIKGTLRVGGRRVDLKAINCPLFLIGGTRDHITPPEQVFALADYVSTPLNQIEKILVKAGHIGLFMGHDVLSTTWVKMGHEIAAVSKRG